MTHIVGELSRTQMTKKLFLCVVAAGVASCAKPAVGDTQSPPPTSQNSGTAPTSDGAALASVDDTQSATKRFKTFLNSYLGPKGDFKIIVTDDLNGDGLTDFIIYNSTADFCGSGGCSYDIFVGRPGGGFKEAEAPGLFGKASVFVREGHAAWKDVFTSEGGGISSYAVYSRNVFDVAKNAYVEVESEFCGGLDFDACSTPVVFCSTNDANLGVSDTAVVYRAPYDENVTIAGPEAGASKIPSAAPQEFNWIMGQTPDGKWVMVNYKFSGIRYVRRAQITGDLPLPHGPCV